MKKKDIKKLFELNNYKVLNIEIYAEGSQANVTVKENINKKFVMFKEFVITKKKLESSDDLITCHYHVFGLEGYYDALLVKGVKNV